ncbi:codanin-1 [Biomphalaria pfeifferi]|uniref:Codanin-1 n=1 Tax=Biomphalaria pfeifferi TaxID=112525 RepID=A0AAD8BJ22_BIOPF|nr:codanin-1 [Biomphalaria pfeifferi]
MMLEEDKTDLFLKTACASQFCNRLREQTKPLLCAGQKHFSPSKSLRETKHDKLKDSKAKKRLTRAKQEPPNGIIERRYGYIPNPRWPKPANAYTKPYEPKGVGANDASGVQGVLFRTQQTLKPKRPSRSTSNHSYIESDFPELSFSAVPRSLKSSTPSNSYVSGRNEESSSGAKKFSGVKYSSMDMNTDKSLSPKTSTPVDNNVYVHSPSPCPVPVVSQSTSLDVEKSLTDCCVHTPESHDLVSSKGRRFQSRQSGSSPVLSDSSSHSSLSIPSPYFHHKSITTECQALAHESGSSRALPLACDVSQTSSTFQSHGSSWSSIVRESSPFPVSEKKNCSDTSPSMFPNKWKENKPGRLSDFTRPGSPFSGSCDASQSPVMSWSQVAKVSLSIGPEGNAQNSSKNAPVKNTSCENENIKLHSRSVDNTVESENRNDKSKRGLARNKHAKSSNNKTVSGFQQTKLTNHSRTSLIQLEDYITPKKQNGKKSGSLGKKNLSMLENRFIEHIEASASSPPKKVRPSPVKKLSFMKNTSCDSSFPDNSGDAKLNIKQKNDSQPLPLQDSQPLTQDFDSVMHNVEAKIKARSKEINMSVLSKRMTERRSPVLSLESLLNAEKAVANDKKDFFVLENEDEDEYINAKSSASHQADIFWKTKHVTEKLINCCSSDVPVIQPESSEDEDNVPDFTLPYYQVTQNVEVEQENVSVVADPEKVTCKLCLRKFVRRYCQFIEEHEVPNVSVEIFFLIQLLTCSQVNQDSLQYVDHHLGGTYFRSVHNGVYFAVAVIKRLRSLFLCLDNTYLELLAASERIKVFSPKLHTFFKSASENRKKVAVTTFSIGHNTFNPQEDGFLSFPDSNYAHVFKCQRDNFYAFYRHYHDTESIYEFKIENQIQYVYDGCTPEQNSMFNLIHLAKLFVDHMILCCVQLSQEKIDVVKMIENKGQNEEMFNCLYESFLCNLSPSEVTPCPAPGFTETQMFFKDFLETLSCPAFNEHLRNILVSKILELNSADYGPVRNLHSIQAIEEDQTPLRCHKFTESVLTLRLLAKLLGYLTFVPYNVGMQAVPPEHASSIIQMRELNPLPLPLPALIKKAYDSGHLSLTIPWIVEYLSMMDPMTPKLSVYDSLLQKLHYIQRYAWTSLYKEGHTNTAVLIVSCISWLFEMPSIPSGFSLSCDKSVDQQHFCDSTNTFHVDRQKLVTPSLLSLACPYLEQGEILLIQFGLNQTPASKERHVLPVGDEVMPLQEIKPHTELQDIVEWLNSSLTLDASEQSLHSKTSVIDDEVIPAYVLTRLFTSRHGNEMAELEVNFIQNNPYIKTCVNMAVELITAKIFDYTLRTILRVLVFEVKVEIRSQFEGTSQGQQSETLKDRILAQSYIIAHKYMARAKTSFYEVVDMCCSKELTQLLTFLTSGHREEIQKCCIHLSKRLVLERVKEWTKVQIYPEFFQRIINKEVEKCNNGNPKHPSLYPTDFSKKLETLSTSELCSGFDEMEQLSELIDKALSYGVWYINALTPGTRPDGKHMIELIEDFIRCVEKSMVTMDFAFYVMSNFLMHLIIQYIVDAPENWTDEAAATFLRLCHVCKAKKLENDKLTIKLSESVRKKKRMKVKVLNLMSVHSLVWLTQSEQMNETLMAYCKLIFQLVESHLLCIETVYAKLTQSRDNHNVSLTVKKHINQILVKLLEMLWESPVTPQTLSYSRERILVLLQSLVSPVKGHTSMTYFVVQSAVDGTVSQSSCLSASAVNIPAIIGTYSNLVYW